MSKSQQFITAEPKPNPVLAAICCCFKTALQVGATVATGVIADKINSSDMSEAQKAALTRLSDQALAALASNVQNGLDKAARENGATLEQNPEMAGALAIGAAAITPVVSVFGPPTIAGTVNDAMSNALHRSDSIVTRSGAASGVEAPRIMFTHERALAASGGSLHDITRADKVVVIKNEKFKEIVNKAIAQLKEDGLISNPEVKALKGGALKGTNAGKAFVDLIIQSHNEQLPSASGSGQDEDTEVMGMPLQDQVAGVILEVSALGGEAAHQDASV